MSDTEETWEQEFEREAREHYRRVMGYDRTIEERAAEARVARIHQEDK